MKYKSTSGSSETISFREAVLRGLAPDNGLYFPVSIATLPKDFFSGLTTRTLAETGVEVMRPFTEGDLSEEALVSVMKETLNFPIPLVELAPGLYTLELFHGPTLAFKDVGARFLARCLGAFAPDDGDITVLVATSGDTGGAVGKGFLDVKGVEVKILYPSGKVSKLQEQQLTTLGKNITAYEVDGTFDDCQRLVKEAFLDDELSQALVLTSANSINIARWLPQSIYYHWAVAQLPSDEPPVISIPSGNYGNLAGGLLAKAMGLPVKKFIAASNANNVIPEYLETGIFRPRPSVSTISNAMDVGNPSNFPRIRDLYDRLFEKIQEDITGIACTDDQTREMIGHIMEKYNYVADPHGAVAFYGLMQKADASIPGIFLETAHPAKFSESMEAILGTSVLIPERLREAMDKPKKSIPLPATLEALKRQLLK